MIHAFQLLKASASTRIMFFTELYILTGKSLYLQMIRVFTGKSVDSVGWRSTRSKDIDFLPLKVYLCAYSLEWHFMVWQIYSQTQDLPQRLPFSHFMPCYFFIHLIYCLLSHLIFPFNMCLQRQCIFISYNYFLVQVSGICFTYVMAK